VCAYVGGVYSPTQNKIYLVPFSQSSVETWHYIDCENGTIIPYLHNSSSTTNGYMSGTYSPTNNKIYFVPYEQSDQSYWHCIDELDVPINKALMANSMFNN
jgi:hypothetical protein